MLSGLFRRSRMMGHRRDCAEVRKLASDYLEADISDEERERIRKHLEECENCSSFMETLRSTITMLRSLPSKAIPQNLKERLAQIPKDQSGGQS